MARPAYYRSRGPRVKMDDGPDKRKYEKETSNITERIKDLENKLKPMPSNATQLIIAEIAKETASLSDVEKAKETSAAEIRIIDTDIRAVGVKYKDKKIVSNDIFAGVRHKSESRHDEAVEKLEQQILIRRCSNSEEMKFRQEIDALQKSKERLAEFLEVKSEVDELKVEQESLRSQRDSLHKKNKELRSKELVKKDKLSKLKQELEEAKERKKVGLTEREELKKEIDGLYKRRKQLYDRFRTEQLAYSEQMRLQQEVERSQRDETRASREAKRKYKAIGANFEREQQYCARTTTCRALILHLQKLFISTNHTGASPDQEDELPGAATPAAVNSDPDVPMRSHSDPSTTTSSDRPPKGYVLRPRGKDREEVLVPTSATITRKKSKKEKRKTPVMKRLNLNPTIFRQFGNLGLSPPNTHSEIPHTLSLLNDKLAYFEGMTKIEFLSVLELDSGVGSTTPSELMDPNDHRDSDFTNSHEETALDLGLGSGISPRRSEMRNGHFKIPSALLPQRSATADGALPKNLSPHALCSVSDESLLRRNDKDLTRNLVSMVSSCTADASNSSIAVGGNEE